MSRQKKPNFTLPAKVSQKTIDDYQLGQYAHFTICCSDKNPSADTLKQIATLLSKSKIIVTGIQHFGKKKRGLILTIPENTRTALAKIVDAHTVPETNGVLYNWAKRADNRLTPRVAHISLPEGWKDLPGKSLIQQEIKFDAVGYKELGPSNCINTESVKYPTLSQNSSTIAKNKKTEGPNTATDKTKTCLVQLAR